MPFFFKLSDKNGSPSYVHQTDTTSIRWSHLEKSITLKPKLKSKKLWGPTTSLKPCWRSPTKQISSPTSVAIDLKINKLKKNNYSIWFIMIHRAEFFLMWGSTCCGFWSKENTEKMDAWTCVLDFLGWTYEYGLRAQWLMLFCPIRSLTHTHTHKQGKCTETQPAQISWLCNETKQDAEPSTITGLRLNTLALAPANEPSAAKRITKRTSSAAESNL